MTRTMKPPIKVPFSGISGDQQHYPSNEWDLNAREEGKWKTVPYVEVQNYEFDDCLTLVDFARGRSAAYFHWEGSDGRRYTMFMTDFVDLVKSSVIIKGSVKGRWTFCKRGANFGVKLVKDEHGF